MKQQLLILNSINGMIWQVYTVESELEIRVLQVSAFKNGFGYTELTSEIEHEESLPGWRNTPEWAENLRLYFESMPSVNDLLTAEHLAKPNDDREGDVHYEKINTLKGVAYLKVCSTIWHCFHDEQRRMSAERREQDEQDWRRAMSDT